MNILIMPVSLSFVLEDGVFYGMMTSFYVASKRFLSIVSLCFHLSLKLSFYYLVCNRDEWEAKGTAIVEEMFAEIRVHANNCE
jgi:hypothetical protein